MARTWLCTVLLAPLALLGCKEREPSPADQAKAAAQIEAAQRVTPPPEPIDLQRITGADFAQNGLDVAGCSFVPEITPGGDPVLVASTAGAVIKVADRFVTLAADVGGPKLGENAYTHYVGAAQSLQIEPAGASASPPGSDRNQKMARLSLSDPFNRVIWSSGGTLVCGPGSPAASATDVTAPG